MKIFKSASILLALVLLLGGNVVASSPKVLISSSGEIQVTNVGNNIIGIELNLELSSGSFSNTAFTSSGNTNYTFDKVSGTKITIYSTGEHDLASDGTITLGNIKTTSSASFISSATLNLVDRSLAEINYENVTVTGKITGGSTGGSTGGTTGGTSQDDSVPENVTPENVAPESTSPGVTSPNSSGSGTSGATDSNSTTNTTEKEEVVEEEEADSEDTFEDLEENLEYYQENNSNSSTDGYVSDESGMTTGVGEDAGYSYLWIVLIVLILIGAGIILYIYNSKNVKNKLSNLVKEMKKTSKSSTLVQKEYNDLHLPEQADGTEINQYNEWK